MHNDAHQRLRLVVSILGVLALIGLWPTAGFAQQRPADAPGSAEAIVRAERATDQAEDSCSATVAPDVARCFSKKRVDANARSRQPLPVSANQPPLAQPNTFGNNNGYDPSWLQAAYNLQGVVGTGGVGKTVAIVDAYDDPNAERDLAQYRSHFGLPPCTTANGCFRKVNQTGSRVGLPAPNSGWAQETSLDLDMVSAICPRCKILLVEARSASFGDLGTAVNTAARLGATAISNSYGAGEWNGETAYESYYNHPGSMVVASSGDAGYGAQYPAASQYVTAVGGTSLYQNTNTGGRDGTESAWSGAGSGCSGYIAKPSWQTGAGCSNRTVADVSAVADPSTGVWVYDTYGTGGTWLIFGGTSVASPIIASVYALAGNSVDLTYGSDSYSHLGNLFDVTSGSNGTCGTYLCISGTGYDGPTGNGTPNGTGAF
jgi:subtilase family serine protease